jgi:hypothetical protein
MPKTYHQFSKQLNEFAIPRALAGLGAGTIAKAAARGIGRAAWETTKTVGSGLAKGLGVDTSVMSGIASSAMSSAKQRADLQRKHDSEVFECPRQVSTANRATNSARNYVSSIERKMKDPTLTAEERTALESALADAKDSVQAAEDYESDIKDKCKVLTKSRSGVAAQKGVQRFEKERADIARTQLACNQCMETEMKKVGITDIKKATDIDREMAKAKCKQCKSKP